MADRNSPRAYDGARMDRAACPRILVVDDDADGAAMLAAALTMMGYVAATAHGAEDALRRASELLPDLALFDIGMPEIDGYELAVRLRATHGPIPIVAITGYARADDRRRSREAGFAAHLAKPVDLDELRALLSTLTR